MGTSVGTCYKMVLALVANSKCNWLVMQAQDEIRVITHLIGDRPNIYSAFGDDSQFQDTLVYAYLIVPSNIITNVESEVRKLKRLYDIPETVPLHCKVLYAGDARKKAGIGHLTSEMVNNLISKVVDLVNSTPMYLRYAYCDYKSHEAFFQQFDGSIELFDKDGKTSRARVPVTFNPKGLLGILASFALVPPPTDSRIPHVENCEVFISEDTTKVKFLGSERRQAHNWCNGFFDITTSKNTVYMIKPKILGSRESVMFELADIMSYICSHARSDPALICRTPC